MVKICPLMTRKDSYQPCLANCALNANGVCALRSISAVSNREADADQALRLALLKQLTTRSR